MTEKAFETKCALSRWIYTHYNTVLLCNIILTRSKCFLNKKH